MKYSLPTIRLRKVVTKIGSGVTPAGGETAYVKNGVAFIRSQNVRESNLDLADVALITQTQHQIMGGSSVIDHDVLLNITGASIGRSCVVPIGTGEANVNQHVCIIRPTEHLNPYFLSQFLNSHLGQKQIWSFQGGGSREGLNYVQIASFEIPSLPRQEQDSIASLLREWHAAIEKTERLITAKNQLLSHLREHHLTKPKQSSRIKLKSATQESTVRNGKRLGREAIMAVTKQVGLRPMRAETIAAAIDRYKVVRPNAFAYNPMRLNIGSIAISSLEDDVLVSPDYVVFECDEAKLLPGYLNHLRRTRLWASHFEAAGSGGVRIRIYYDDLAAFVFPLPPLAEQARVLAVLDAGVTEIETLEHYLAALKTQKRGLMQKLLTGQWRAPSPPAPLPLAGEGGRRPGEGKHG